MNDVPIEDSTPPSEAPRTAPPEAQTPLADHARRLAPDPAAYLVACAVGLALAITAAATLFH